MSQLRSQVATLENVTRPRRSEVEKLIDQAETRHQQFLTALEQVSAAITTKRQEKAGELTDTLGDYVQIHIKKSADRDS